MNKDGILYTVIFTFIGAFIFVSLLSLANAKTRHLVEANEKTAYNSALLKAAGLYQDGTPDEIEALFQESFIVEKEWYQTQVQGETVYVLPFSGSGLWGTIQGVIAFDRTISRIVGLELISHSETPGLGGRIDEQWFKDQFTNEAIPDGTIRVNKGSGSADTNSENSQVDGITGASLTSQSIEVMVNQAISDMKLYRGGM